MLGALPQMALGPAGPAPEGLERAVGLQAVLSRVELAPRGPTRIGRFVIKSRLGAGAMGIVYRAHDPELDRPVAIKITRRACDDSVREQVRAEARALARAAHPNVVGVHEIGCHHGELYVVMELVEGRSLESWIREEEPGHRATLAACVQAARGLAAVHRAGLVHRDIKPANILVGWDGRVRIADFGLAATKTQVAASREVACTPAYGAPEVLAGHPADTRSDQFSFCRTMLDALERTGVPATGPALLALHRGCTPLPEARWPSMEALTAELSRHGHWHGG